ncbi:hypothetical protein ASZ90_019759 [hydrocarbon metagenome]|uniref:Uncharacterized protein n=1 Tax=hydrocarbon metagenome TaxID=938273 RepID=A0A0W8E2K6_9ZZZZ
MGIGNLGLIDYGNAGKIMHQQQKTCHVRNPETAVKGPKFKELSSQLSDTLGESVNVTVANVPGNKTAVGRYAAGCEQECNITIAPNIAAKALKDPAKMEELQTAIQGYLDQCAGIDQEDNQIERSGLVLLANGDSKTWAVAGSAVEGAAGEDESAEESVSTSISDILSKFDYVFEKTTTIKHFSKYSETMQMLLASTTEISSILDDEDSSVEPADGVSADAGISDEGVDTGGEVESELTTGDTALASGEEPLDESAMEMSAEEEGDNTADGVEAV